MQHFPSLPCSLHAHLRSNNRSPFLVKWCPTEHSKEKQPQKELLLGFPDLPHCPLSSLLTNRAQAHLLPHSSSCRTAPFLLALQSPLKENSSATRQEPPRQTSLSLPAAKGAPRPLLFSSAWWGSQLATSEPGQKLHQGNNRLLRKGSSTFLWCTTAADRGFPCPVASLHHHPLSCWNCGSN